MTITYVPDPRKADGKPVILEGAASGVATSVELTCPDDGTKHDLVVRKDQGQYSVEIQPVS